MKAREMTLQEDQWDLTALYRSEDQWENEFSRLAASSKGGKRWLQLEPLSVERSTDPFVWKELLQHYLEADRALTKLYTYVHLKHDEDIAQTAWKSRFDRAVALLHQFAQHTAWIQPHLLALPEETIQQLLCSPELAPYRFYLENIVRLKPHTLSQEGERLLALSAEAMQTSHRAFSALSDADFKFGVVEDAHGKQLPLSHGTYALYLRDTDRVLRERAFSQYHQHYLNHENALCELLAGAAQTHWSCARARGYKSSLEAALFPKNIDTTVYHELIACVREGLAPLHHYFDVRKRVLQVPTLHCYDLYVPLVPAYDQKIDYARAEELVVEAMFHLGAEYQEVLRRGLLEQRWVDRYENKNKRSGAYSSGCYDSHPYILMNYKGLLRDVFTLAHEAGHSMHSFYSRSKQPYQYSDYSIFLAEVASTFNEDLLFHLLMHQATAREEKAFLLNQKIEDLRSTLFRQTMFAEFELWVHGLVEAGEGLSPQRLKEKYRQLQTDYFGPAVEVDALIEIEWARIPHFYYNFYVFQYATGISAALALSEKVRSGGKEERSRYLDFLQGGSSRYPLEMLHTAGIDMRTSFPVRAAIRSFQDSVAQFEQLI